MDSLGIDSLIYIAEYLSPRDLVQFGSVCKWFHQVHLYGGLWLAFLSKWRNVSNKFINKKNARDVYIQAVTQWQLFLLELGSAEVQWIENISVCHCEIRDKCTFCGGSHVTRPKSIRLPPRIPEDWLAGFLHCAPDGNNFEYVIDQEALDDAEDVDDAFDMADNEEFDDFIQREYFGRPGPQRYWDNIGQRGMNDQVDNFMALSPYAAQISEKFRDLLESVKIFARDDRPTVHEEIIPLPRFGFGKKIYINHEVSPAIVQQTGRIVRSNTHQNNALIAKKPKVNLRKQHKRIQRNKAKLHKRKFTKRAFRRQNKVHNRRQPKKVNYRRR